MRFVGLRREVGTTECRAAFGASGGVERAAMSRFILSAMAVSVTAMAAVSAFVLPEKLFYNASASAPVGFYWLDNEPIERGDFVILRPPERVQEFIVERGILPPDTPLLKRVAGLSGDEICRRGAQVFINGAAAVTANTTDGEGRSMPVWQGCHVLRDGEFLVLSHHPASFDGRYFGAVDERFIVGRVTHLQFPRRQRDP